MYIFTTQKLLITRPKSNAKRGPDLVSGTFSCGGMDFTDSSTATTTTTSSSSSSVSPAHDEASQEEHYVASVNEDYETTCWGCGVHLLLSPYAPVFKCGWCGAITNQNAGKREDEYSWWRHLRDRCFVSVLLGFMIFMICGGIWAVYPVVFSLSFSFGVIHSTIAVFLSLSTLSSFSLAAFRSAGVSPTIPWGSYPTVGKDGLENYTFCHYCSRPKPPRAHHCRTCGKCILDMDHHCPFIGNCVGAANHRSFIVFLISAVVSSTYVSISSAYSVVHIWHPLEYRNFSFPTGFANMELSLRTLKEITLAFLRSMVFLPVRELVLIYLFFTSVAVGTGLIVLLWQQLCYIYEGKTYLSHLNSDEGDDAENRDCQNFIRFFGWPHFTTIYLPRVWNFKKSHAK